MRDPGLLSGGPWEGARGGPSALGGVGANMEEPRMGCMVFPGGARPLAWEPRAFGGRDIAVGFCASCATGAQGRRVLGGAVGMAPVVLVAG